MSDQDRELGELAGRVGSTERQIELFRKSLDNFQLQIGSLSTKIEERLDASVEKILNRLDSKADVAQVQEIKEDLNKFKEEATANFETLNNSKLIWNTKTKIYMSFLVGFISIGMTVFSIVASKVIDAYWH